MTIVKVKRLRSNPIRLHLDNVPSLNMTSDMVRPRYNLIRLYLDEVLGLDMTSYVIEPWSGYKDQGPILSDFTWMGFQV